jgi:hypothetical protein
MYLALIILPLLGSIASGLLRFTPGFSSTSCRGIRNKQTVPKKFLHSNTNCKGYYYTGFFDAEGCFRVKIAPLAPVPVTARGGNKKYSTGWHIHPNFSIVGMGPHSFGMPYDLGGAPVSHKRDLLLLKQINEFLGGLGKIYVAGVNKGEGVVLEFNTMAGLIKVIDHLNRYPLITQKRADYELFKKVVEMVSRKEHLTMEGLQRIVSIRASLNKGLTDLLKNALPNIVRLPRPSVEFKGIPDPHWLAGFVDGEWCFFVSVLKSMSCKLGTSVSLEFNITQHYRDEALMKGLKNFLGCGRIKSDSRSPSLYFVVTKFTDITTKIIPFFAKYSLQSVKCLDYADFRGGPPEIMKVKEHLTPKGLEQIREIKDGMNKGRIFIDINRLRGTEKFERKKCT